VRPSGPAGKDARVPADQNGRDPQPTLTGRAGYLEEGILRQRSIHRGHPVDDVIYGRLPTDPRPSG
jgi:hypothetical protein